MQDIKITALTKSMLADALEQNLYWDAKKKVVPFSKPKAKWLLKNERIENDDVCAILGYENDELISFIYLVPDYLKTKNGLKKVFWSNRWWVHEKYENSVLPTYTKTLSLNATNKQILVRYVGSETIEYYKKQTFTKFGKRNKYIFVFSLDYHLITNKIKALKTVSPLLKITARCSHFSIAVFNKLKIYKSKKSIAYKYLETIDDNDWEFIKKHCENDLIPKSKSYLNWQIDNQQYLETSTTNKAPYKCLLSSVSHKIHNRSFLVINKNKTIGFISVLIRDNEFIVRYFLSNQTNYNLCLTALMDHFITSKCTYILTDDEVLGKHIKLKFMSTYVNIKEQFSLAHDTIDFNFDGAIMKQQDGYFE
ncbi:hypothetical protein [Gelatiniphilus marinus]|uniref:GNAT family N-acetyltransferase n=1 Tax=Gelatiniphilus marinus TaxID=1759464 RepID=A0ABW5JRD6_9FLAO